MRPSKVSCARGSRNTSSDHPLACARGNVASLAAAAADDDPRQARRRRCGGGGRGARHAAGERRRAVATRAEERSGDDTSTTTALASLGRGDGLGERAADRDLARRLFQLERRARALDDEEGDER